MRSGTTLVRPSRAPNTYANVMSSRYFYDRPFIIDTIPKSPLAMHWPINKLHSLPIIIGTRSPLGRVPPGQQHVNHFVLGDHTHTHSSQNARRTHRYKHLRFCACARARTQNITSCNHATANRTRASAYTYVVTHNWAPFAPRYMFTLSGAEHTRRSNTTCAFARSGA